MRRWFEFGWDQNTTTPTFFPTSNQSHQKGQEASNYPPIFISMPYKDQLFEILNGVSLVGYQAFDYVIFTATSGGSTAAPLTNANAGDSCTAEHVVSGTNPYGWRIQFTYTGGFLPMLIGGFPKPDSTFTPNLLQQNFAPPSDNG